jgi:TolB-like protein
MRRFLSACLLLISLTGPAIAEIYVSVAPVAVDARDKEAPSAALVQELLISCLSQTDGVAVVERGDLNAVMDEKSQSMTGFNHDKGLAPHLYGVNYVITGSVTATGNDWLISLQANDPATAQIVAAQSVALKPRQVTAALCGSVAAPLAGQLIHRPQNHAFSGAAEKPEDAQMQTMMLKGIGYANSHAYAQAFPLFLKVLGRDPHNVDACYWLAVSYDGAGLDELAQNEAASCLALHPAHSRRRELEALLPPPGKPAPGGSVP